MPAIVLVALMASAALARPRCATPSARIGLARAPVRSLRVAMADGDAKAVAAAGSSARGGGWVTAIKSRVPWSRTARAIAQAKAAAAASDAAMAAKASDAAAFTGLPDLNAEADLAEFAEAQAAAAVAAGASASAKRAAVSVKGAGATAPADAEEDAEAAEEEGELNPILEDSDVERSVWVIDLSKDDGTTSRLQVLLDASGKAIWEPSGFPPIPRTGQWSLRSDRLLFTREMALFSIGFKETYVASPTVDATDDLKLRTSGICRGWGYFSPALKIGDFEMVRKATNVGGGDAAE
jgi:hypothetical protein